MNQVLKIKNNIINNPKEYVYNLDKQSSNLGIPKYKIIEFLLLSNKISTSKKELITLSFGHLLIFNLKNIEDEKVKKIISKHNFFLILSSRESSMTILLSFILIITFLCRLLY